MCIFVTDLPGTVINATLNRDQCDTNALLSWTSPVSHTPILNYTLIDVIPVIGNIFEESTLTPNISLTLQLGTVHNISIQAHNCVGGGAKGYINETTTNGKCYYTQTHIRYQMKFNFCGFRNPSYIYTT